LQNVLFSFNFANESGMSVHEKLVQKLLSKPNQMI